MSIYPFRAVRRRADGLRGGGPSRTRRVPLSLAPCDMHIYIYIYRYISLSLSLYIYIYIHLSLSIYLSLSLYLYIYIYITCISISLSLSLSLYIYREIDIDIICAYVYSPEARCPMLRQPLKPAETSVAHSLGGGGRRHGELMGQDLPAVALVTRRRGAHRGDRDAETADPCTALYCAVLRCTALCPVPSPLPNTLRRRTVPQGSLRQHHELLLRRRRVVLMGPRSRT